MAIPYTPTTFQRAGRSTVAGSWPEHWNLIFNGWTAIGAAPSQNNQFGYVTRDELGDFETDPDVMEFRDRLMAFVSDLVDDFLAAHPGAAEGAATAAALPFSPTGTIAATNTQAAVAEVASEAAAALTAHRDAATAHNAGQISVTGITGATNAQAAFATLRSEVTASVSTIAGKVDSSATLTAPPSGVLYSRNLDYTMNVAHPDLARWSVQGVVRAWQNEWGAWRFSNPYPTYCDAGFRFTVNDGDYVGTGGGGGNALEISDRRSGVTGGAQQLWGRRASTGELVRRGVVMADTYVRTGGPGAALPAGLVNCLVATTVTPVPVV